MNNLPHGSVLKSVFLEMKDLCESATTNNWCSNVLKLASSYNLDISNLEFSEPTKQYREYIKDEIKQKFISDWLSKINDSVNNPGLRLYKLFKFDFRCEPYLQNVKQFKHRKMFTKLRTNSHLLEIEHGKHLGKLAHDRLCSVCHVVEDEFHFIMVCPLYNELRHNFLAEITSMFPLLNQYSLYDKFLFLMGFDDYNIHCIFSKFIHDAFKVRSDLGSTLPPAGDLCQSSDDGGSPS